MKKIIFSSLLLSLALFSCSLDCVYNVYKNETEKVNNNDDSLFDSDDKKPNAGSEMDLTIYLSIPSISSENNQQIIISPDGSSIVFDCAPYANSSTISYQWFTSPYGTTDKVLKIEDATSRTYKTGELSKGVHYFYCTTTSIVQDDEDLVYKLETNAFTVAYTGLPTVYIDTPNEAEIPPKTEDWLGNASITLKYPDNPEWEFENLSTNIFGAEVIRHG